jgi:digeranylgeranylglycerophospholipid reductase
MLATTVTGLLMDKKRIVGVRTDMDDISGKIIIGADGVESRVGRWCGMIKQLKLNQIYSALQYTLVDWEANHDCFEIHFGERFAPGGYGWVFPKGKMEANLGIGVLASMNKKPRSLLDIFKSERAREAVSTRFSAGCIPSTRPLSRAVSENVILVGDAARQTNPVSGGGIANGLISGRLAGETAGKVTSEGLPLSRLQDYDRLWHGELAEILEKKYKQRRFLETDRTMERLVAILRFMAVFRPILPKSVYLKWIKPNF